MAQLAWPPPSSRFASSSSHKGVAAAPNYIQYRCSTHSTQPHTSCILSEPEALQNPVLHMLLPLVSLAYQPHCLCRECIRYSHTASSYNCHSNNAGCCIPTTEPYMLPLDACCCCCGCCGGSFVAAECWVQDEQHLLLPVQAFVVSFAEACAVL